MILEIYNSLHKSYGPQGWWPVTPIGQTKPVYHSSNSTRHLTSREQTEIMIGAILTQNTAWTNVEKALANLHDADLIDFAKLAKARQSTLARNIRSAGYYNQKSIRLKEFAKYMSKNYGPSFQAIQNKDPQSLRQGASIAKGCRPRDRGLDDVIRLQKTDFCRGCLHPQDFRTIGYR